MNTQNLEVNSYIIRTIENYVKSPVLPMKMEISDFVADEFVAVLNNTLSCHVDKVREFKRILKNFLELYEELDTSQNNIHRMLREQTSPTVAMKTKTRGDGILVVAESTLGYWVRSNRSNYYDSRKRLWHINNSSHSKNMAERSIKSGKITLSAELPEFGSKYVRNRYICGVCLKIFSKRIWTYFSSIAVSDKTKILLNDNVSGWWRPIYSEYKRIASENFGVRVRNAEFYEAMKHYVGWDVSD